MPPIAITRFVGQRVRADVSRSSGARTAAGLVLEGKIEPKAIASAREDSPELAVVDLRMPDRSGLEAIRELLAIDGTTRIVVLTGYGSIATAVDAIKLGATYYLTKPTSADQIVAAFGYKGPSGDVAPSERTLSVDRLEWEHIQRVLSNLDGNISAAARALNMHRRTLQRKLSKYPPKS